MADKTILDLPVLLQVDVDNSDVLHIIDITANLDKQIVMDDIAGWILQDSEIMPTFHSNTPIIAYKKDDGGVDEKVWEWAVAATTLSGRVNNDALSSSEDWITITRSTNSISTVAFPFGNINMGNGVFRLNKSNAQIGINRDPTKMLDLQSATQYEGIRLNNASNIVAILNGQDADNDNGALTLNDGGSIGIFLQANGDSYFNNGEVGIGIAAPTNLFHIESATQYKGIKLSNTSNTVIELFGNDADNDNGSLLLYDAGALKVKFLAVGDSYFTDSLGIGVTGALTEKLEVDGRIKDKTGYVIPVGATIPYGGSSAPAGWLMCDGSAVSRTTYADLFAVIGVTFGVGDGSTTFNLPDLRGIFVRGAGTNGTLQDATGSYFTGVLGTYQNDKFQGHWHDVPDNTSVMRYVAGATAARGSNNITTNSIEAQDPITDSTNGTPRTGSESNPANLGMNHIIKT